MTILFAPANNSAADNIALLNSDNVVYKIKYWGIHHFGATSRALLAFGGASFELEDAVDWGKEKAGEPLEVMPVLTVIADGQELKIAEAMTIELYLAKRYNLLGDNEWESLLIQSFYSSTSTVFSRLNFRVFQARPENRRVELDFLLRRSLPEFARIHETHLEANKGGNGHYVGNRISLADIRTTVFLHYLELAISQDQYKHIIHPDVTPNLFKVKAAVEANENYAAWMASPSHKTLDEETIAVTVEDNPLFRPDLARPPTPA